MRSSGVARILRAWFDPFVAALVATMLLALLVPTSPQLRDAASSAATVAVTLLFLLYGMRLRTREVLDGLRNVRLQGGILTATYVLFPVLGLLASWALAPVIGRPFALGVLYLSLLPSTVQSSVALTSVARGNVAGAICGATVSNVVGMILTPVLVLTLMGGAGSTGIDGVRGVLLQLLLPFAVGQVLQPWTGRWVRARRALTLTVDRGTILVVVYAAVATATADGVWASVAGWSVVVLAVVCLALLAVVLATTWWAGARLGLALEDRIALLMCGSKKSLATGLPMASVLFPAATAATLAVPVIVFHQIQLVVCAVIARRLALRPH